MNAKTKDLFEARAKIVKAAAHPTRLFIIHVLARRERCVCELRDLVGGDLSTVSKHLTILKNAGILEDAKRGLQVFYRLRCPCILDFFSCIEGVLRENVKRQLQLIERRTPAKRLRMRAG